jgi:RNA polymerase sigma-70 factor (ECF subfamily)
MLDQRTERLVIQRARQGDREAITTLIQSYQRPLEAFLLRLCGKPELAEDLAQEAFVRVIRSLDRFDDQYRFSTWLFTIGKRLLVNAQQKMRPTSDSEMVEYRAGDARTPLLAVENAEREQRICRLVEIAIDSLVSPQREIVLLFHQQGWPVQRIAAELRMPEGTVKSHLFRARRRMLFAIEQSGVSNPEEVLR